MLNLTVQDIENEFVVTYEVNNFILYMMKDFGEVLIGGYYNKNDLKKEIKLYGIKNVSFHGLAIKKYLND